MAEGPVAKRKKLDDAVASSDGIDANEVIKFRLLHTSSNGAELAEEASFGPDMAHQFFGDDEVCKHALTLVWFKLKFYAVKIDICSDARQMSSCR